MVVGIDVRGGGLERHHVENYVNRYHDEEGYH
jgi:hypothetical protein